MSDNAKALATIGSFLLFMILGGMLGWQACKFWFLGEAEERGFGKWKMDRKDNYRWHWKDEL